MSKKEKILLVASLAGIGIVGYFGFKEIEMLKKEIELLEQDVGNMYRQFAGKIETMDIDIEALYHHLPATKNSK